MDEVNTVIEAVRAEGQYHLILDVAAGAIAAADPSLDGQRQQAEREAVLRALSRCGNNRTLAARLLGWRPAEFWAATPAELFAALAPAESEDGAGLDRTEVRGTAADPTKAFVSIPRAPDGFVPATRNPPAANPTTCAT